VSGDFDDVLAELKRAERHARSALKLARNVPAHHGVASWAELDWTDLAEFEPPALLAATVADALSDATRANGRKSA
jgi:hypothetical protein